MSITNEITSLMGYQALRELYPWPDTRPYEAPLGLDSDGDGGGRELVDELIADYPGGIFVEIGAFMGNSALRWLTKSPNLVVICIDTWIGSDWADEMETRGSHEFARRLREPNGAEKCFRANLWEYRNRALAVRGGRQKHYIF